jgi:hypothetical protein
MPGVLSEGLFLSNPRELRMLRSPRVRQAMANAYYEAIARYLGRRGSHVGYALVDAPPAAVAGSDVELTIDVRNAGDDPMRGWRLDVRATPAEALARGEAGPRPSVGTRRIPALAPGSRRTLRLRVTAPVEPGDWVLLVDAIDAQGARASHAGSPVLEIHLRVSPDPSASPIAASPQPPSPRASVGPS